tara:strand:+ start:89 stop:1123 length:1035 start_codon:yes stop_codon:yes gene_type:complete
MTNIPEKDGELARKLLAHMDRMTWDRYSQIAYNNARNNFSFLKFGQSLSAIRDQKIGKGNTAVVVAAGPSIKRQNPATLIKEFNYEGAIIVAESAIAYCLRNGIVPDLAITIDPGQGRTIRWLGDPNLTVERLQEDDYFARQDQDDAFTDELRANEQIIKLLEQHGKDIRIALSTMADESLVNRILDVGMDIYWFNPMIDNPDIESSLTAKLQRDNNLPSVNAGGNVGTASWLFADAVLEKEHVALTGVDFSYYDGTPYINTQYYYEAINLVGKENLDALFVRIDNPYTNTTFFTDPAYLWYRECFLEMAKDADCTTYNCTEGGILFGENIETIPFRSFLERFA